ncbi:MAG: hypothetical protein WB615_05255 [Candidatus Tumulicola sp.]
MRRFFADPAVTELGDSRERCVLEHIHELIRNAAERYRDRGCKAGRDQSTLLEYKILTMQCLERRPIREVAAALGISSYYCYRRRANICRHVARDLLEYENDPRLDFLSDIDEFQLLLDVARHGSVLDDIRPTLLICERLISSAQTSRQRIEALRMQANTFLRAGNLCGALKPRTEAMAVLRAEELHCSPDERDLLVALVDLLDCRIERFRANKVEALCLARRSASLLKVSHLRATPSIKWLYVESLFELTATLCNIGDFEQAYDSIKQAESNLEHLGPSATWLHARVMVMLWRLRSNLLLSSNIWCPSSQRVRGLVAAFKQACLVGALAESTEALVGLTDHYAWAGKDAEALNAARAALLISRQQSERARLHAAIRLGLSLSITRFRERALSMLPDPSQLECCDEFHRSTLTYLMAEKALSNGRFDSAWALASRPNDTSEYTTLTISRWLVAAASAHELGRMHDARALVERAIPAAERSGVAPILRDAYLVGAKITNNRRMQRRSKEVANVLAS